jgi:putative addiction module killer protein
MTQVTEYLDAAGRSPFGHWFETLKPQARAKVTAALYRMEQGNMGDTKSLGDGLHERRIHWGPGLRIYFGREGGRLVVLLGGGIKSGQQRDIKATRKLWTEYRQRKEA